jgi:hypothetical protein
MILLNIGAKTDIIALQKPHIKLIIKYLGFFSWTIFRKLIYKISKNEQNGTVNKI